MSLQAWCEAIQASSVGTAIRESTLVFPIIETTHVLAIGLSVGLVLLLDFRLISAAFRATTPHRIVRGLKGWYLAGFLVMFVSGGLLFWSEALRCYESPAFRWKMAFLALAGLNAALFEVKYARDVDAWSARIPMGARAVGWCSIVSWAAVIALGRWTAYRLG
jgi:hypothetical protein